jgi:hypothetical protein
MRPPLLGCTALASTLVLACSEPSAPPVPTSDAEAVSPQTAALVNRFTFPFFATLVDGDLIAVIGLSPAQLPAFCAGDESVLDPIHILEVTRPDGSLKVTTRSRPRLIIYSAVGISEVCELTSATPLATGKGQLNQTDNDVFVSLNRTNSFGLSFSGIASGDGGRFKVRARFRATIQRNGEGRVRTERFEITQLGN